MNARGVSCDVDLYSTSVSVERYSKYTSDEPDDLTLAKVYRKPMHEIWRYEDVHFTRWLVDNIDAVGDVIDLELSNPQREVAAGSFRLDLLAEDADGSKVIIENQFGRSDHDHLGKLITYLTAFEATAAIWIVETTRPERVRAITWLNDATSGSFYSLKVEAISIGGSAAGPLLTLVVGPSEESKGVGSVNREWVERHHLRHDFWKDLLERAQQVLPFHAGRSPGTSTYYSVSTNVRGLSFVYVVRWHDTRVELYIDRGEEYENDRLFRTLIATREEVAEVFGGGLVWEPMPGKRACRITYRMNSGGYRDSRETWPQIIDEMVDAMARLSRALEPAMTSLAVQST